MGRKSWFKEESRRRCHLNQMWLIPRYQISHKQLHLCQFKRQSPHCLSHWLWNLETCSLVERRPRHLPNFQGFEKGFDQGCPIKSCHQLGEQSRFQHRNIPFRQGIVLWTHPKGYRKRIHSNLLRLQSYDFTWKLGTKSFGRKRFLRNSNPREQTSCHQIRS